MPLEQLNKINTVLNLLYREIEKFSDKGPMSLSAGTLCNSLFFYKYGVYLNDESILDLSYEEFEKVYSKSESFHITEESVNIIDNFGGIAWLFQYFVNNNFIEYDEKFLDYFDHIILQRCQNEIKIKNYDLFYGIIGCGNYFLQRAKYDRKYISYLDLIVNLLYDVKDENDIIWNDKFSKAKNYINFGLAHGLPSQIVFFSKIYRLTKNLKAQQLAKSAIDFILKYKSGNINSGSLFPNFVSYSQDEFDYNSRLAWCYGDIGIGYSILYFSEVTQSDFYKNSAIEILQKAATLKIENLSTGVRDKCFCHGTSGIFHIFNNVVNKFNLPEFEDAQKYWLDKTLENYSDISSFYTHAFDFDLDEEKYIKDAGLIEGYAGIGLSLLSYLNNTGNEWEDLFML